MKRMFLVGLVFAIVLLSVDAFASGYVELFTDMDDCSMKEVGHAALENPVILSGEKIAIIPSLASCQIKVDKVSFEKDFSFCALTGIRVEDKMKCDFTYGEKEETYYFHFGANQNSSCYYSCLKASK